jgi:hypothetical protein
MWTEIVCTSGLLFVWKLILDTRLINITHNIFRGPESFTNVGTVADSCANFLRFYASLRFGTAFRRTAHWTLFLIREILGKCHSLQITAVGYTFQNTFMLVS